MDAVGSNIRVDTYGWEVKRILPRLNNNINEEWISDKTRYACDGLLKQRLDKPYKKENGRLVETNWDDAINIVCSKIKETEKKYIAGHVGDLQNMETINSFKSLLGKIGVNSYDFREKPFYINSKNKKNYLFNSSIVGIEDSDCIVLIGCNPRHEATILNARIRKTFISKKIPIFSFGDPGDLTYDYKLVGNKTSDLKKFLNKEDKVSKIFLNSKKPIVIIGESALEQKSGKYIFESTKKFLSQNNFITEKWNALNILLKNASSVGSLDLEFLDKNNNLDYFDKLKNNQFKLLYLVGSDNLNFTKKNEFIIYQGSHGDRVAQMADIVLPSPAFTEQNGLFINLEGRLQKSVKATYPPGEAKDDWKIFNMISKQLTNDELFRTFLELRKDTLSKVKNNSDFDLLPQTKTNNLDFENSDFIEEPIIINQIDYYFTNSIARSSKTMSDCRVARSDNFKKKTGS